FSRVSIFFHCSCYSVSTSNYGVKIHQYPPHNCLLNNFISLSYFFFSCSKRVISFSLTIHHPQNQTTSNNVTITFIASSGATSSVAIVNSLGLLKRVK